LEEPEDLVFVTVVEKVGDNYSASSWAKQDKTDIALESAKGVTTFNLPTCMRHGSKSVRSLRTKLIAVLGFFVLFYPILFYLLSINVAVNYERDLANPLTGFLVTFTALILILLYGFFPRALERSVRFHRVSRTKDAVLLSLSNPEYMELFLELNGMVVGEPEVVD
jgi:cytochrome c biogenesis protein CcdA